MSNWPSGTAAAANLAMCHVCAKLAPIDLQRCPRCQAALHARIPNSLASTVALMLTAIILLVPANLLPIMITNQFGRSVDSTIVGGVILLWQMGSYPIAAIIFVASVVVPIGKLLALATLVWSVQRGSTISRRQRAVLYRITEFIGRWSMIDVFVVSILVALIQLTGVLVIRPGLAAMAFAGVVIVTMVAAEQFDPRLIWDQTRGKDEPE